MFKKVGWWCFMEGDICSFLSRKKIMDIRRKITCMKRDFEHERR